MNPRRSAACFCVLATLVSCVQFLARTPSTRTVPSGASAGKMSVDGASKYLAAYYSLNGVGTLGMWDTDSTTTGGSLVDTAVTDPISGIGRDQVSIFRGWIAVHTTATNGIRVRRWWYTFNNLSTSSDEPLFTSFIVGTSFHHVATVCDFDTDATGAGYLTFRDEVGTYRVAKISDAGTSWSINSSTLRTITLPGFAPATCPTVHVDRYTAKVWVAYRAGTSQQADSFVFSLDPSDPDFPLVGELIVANFNMSEVIARYGIIAMAGNPENAGLDRQIRLYYQGELLDTESHFVSGTVTALSDDSVTGNNDPNSGTLWAFQTRNASASTVIRGYVVGQN